MNRLPPFNHIMTTFIVRIFSLLSLIALFSLLPAVSQAARNPAECIRDSMEVLSEIQRIPEKSIPDELLSRCRGVAIFPNVYKVGFLVGASFGHGVLLAKDMNTGKWHGPAFLTIGGGSLGWQIGVQAMDLVLVIMNERGVEAFMHNNLTLGGDIAVAAGPVGRKLKMSTDIGLRAEVYSYSRTKGFFAGISLAGAYLGHDYQEDEAFYGMACTPREILTGRLANYPPLARQLAAMLEKRPAGRSTVK